MASVKSRLLALMLCLGIRYTASLAPYAYAGYQASVRGVRGVDTIRLHAVSRSVNRPKGSSASRPQRGVASSAGPRSSRGPRGASASYSPTRSRPSSSSSSSKLPTSKKSFSSSSSANDEDDGRTGVRVNKCIPSLSRRAADEAIRQERVTINGKVAVSGDRLQFGDSVKLDGKIQHWEGAAKAKEQRPQSILENQKFSYVKFWKPRGVTCTSDRKDPDNIITRGGFKLFPQRMFTVGRLDKDSTGLILLTSDGRVNNALLNPHSKNEKEYEVTLSKVPSDEQIKDLRDGVVITTVMQRDTYSKPVTARTKPCIVERVGEPKHRKLRIVLTEGRNRQIRRMVETLGNGFHVVELHRTRFCGVSLKGVAHGHWKELEPKEMDVIVNKIASNNDRIERLKAEGKAEKDNTYVYMEDGEE